MTTPKVWSLRPAAPNDVRDMLADAGTPLRSHHRQVHAVVAAPSRAAAVRVFNVAGFRSVTDHEMKTYGHTTGNPADIEAATAAPMRVLVSNDSYRSGTDRTYVQVPPSPDLLLDDARAALLRAVADGTTTIEADRFRWRDASADGHDDETVQDLVRIEALTCTKAGQWKVSGLGKELLRLYDADVRAAA